MSNLADPNDITDYWLNTLKEEDWYRANDDVDAEIRTRFLATWEAAHAGGCRDWLTSAQGTLAFVILTDQFARNMFRGDGRSFATDAMAVRACEAAIDKGWDMEIPEPARQFIYVPFMHSEDLLAQDKGIQYFANRMPETGHHNIEHAHAHRWVIAEFGRFPYRNAALGRAMSPAEEVFLEAGGYGHALATVRAQK